MSGRIIFRLKCQLQVLHFCPEFYFLAKYSRFDKILLIDQIYIFWIKFKCFNEILFFDQNCSFDQNFNFGQNFIFDLNFSFDQNFIFDQKLIFDQMLFLTESLFLTKISTEFVHIFVGKIFCCVGWCQPSKQPIGSPDAQ